MAAAPMPAQIMTNSVEGFFLGEAMTNRADWIDSRRRRGERRPKGTDGRRDLGGGGAKSSRRRGNDILIGDDVSGVGNHATGEARGSRTDTGRTARAATSSSPARRRRRNYPRRRIPVARRLRWRQGFDTLQLTITHAELRWPRARWTFADGRTVLECKATPWSKTQDLRVQELSLDVRDFRRWRSVAAQYGAGSEDDS